MQFYERVRRKLYAGVWNKNRANFCKRIQAELINRDFTIFSVNCIGGVVTHSLGLPFRSPTVNLYMGFADFVKFCENPKRYVNAPFVEYVGKDNEKYPLALLDDLLLHLVHYASFEEAKAAWERRADRINWENIFIVGTDRDGCTPELMKRFDALPYHKVLFVHLPDNTACHFYIKGFEDQQQVGNIIKQSDYKSGKLILDQFDWIQFLNKGIVR